MKFSENGEGVCVWRQRLAGAPGVGQDVETNKSRKRRKKKIFHSTRISNLLLERVKII